MPVLDQHLDTIDNVLCEMKSLLQLITWLDTCGEAQAQHESIMVMQHTLLRHVLAMEAQLQGVEG